jgi:hypothetical protein
MLLVMTKDRDRPDRISCRDQGYLFVLGRRATQPVNIDGRPQEFMITGALGTHAKGLIVEPVTTAYKLVAHNGFECAGTMCSTTAWTADTAIGWLTPGRVQDLLPIAENVNVGWNGRTAQPRTPGHVFVKIGERRAAGLPDLTEIDMMKWAALIRHRKMLAEHRQQTPAANAPEIRERAEA